MKLPLVIGAGNVLRGDDGAGRILAQRLAGRAGALCEVAESSGDAADLIARFAGRDRVIVIDACQTGAESGTLYRFDVSQKPLPARLTNLSSHGFGVGEAVELARALHTLPRTVIVHAIEGAAFETGTGLSAEVEDALEALLTSVVADVREMMAAGAI